MIDLLKLWIDCNHTGRCSVSCVIEARRNNFKIQKLLALLAATPVPQGADWIKSIKPLAVKLTSCLRPTADATATLR